MQQIYHALFQRKVSSERNCNNNCHGGPAGLPNWLIVLLLFTLCILLLKHRILSKRATSDTHLYIALYSKFSRFIWIAFTRHFPILKNRSQQYYCNGHIDIEPLYLRLHRNKIITVLSTIGISYTVASIASLYLNYFSAFHSQHTPQIFVEFPPKQF